MKQKLYCFIGKPGSGKSTLLQHLIVKFYDVYDYIKPYLNEHGALRDENLALQAYKDFFSALLIKEGPFYIELGTNYPEFVVSQLARFDTTVFLCILPDDLCIQRARSRNRRIATESLQRRIARPFPQQHLTLLNVQNIAYYRLNMINSVEENTNQVNKIIFKP